MQLRLILLLSVLCFSACSKTPVSESTQPEDNGAATATAASESPSTSASDSTTGGADTSAIVSREAAKDSGAASDPKLTAKPEADTPSPEAIAAAALAKRVKEAQDELDDLESQFGEANRAWQKEMRRARDRETRISLMQNSPGAEFAKKYLALADKFPDTPAASTSLTNAMQRGRDETKKIASGRLFDAAPADTGTLQWEGLMISIAQAGDDQTKLKASQALADLIAKDPQSAASGRIAPQMLGLRGDHPGKNQVAQILIDLTDQDAGSEKSFDSLFEVASATSGKLKTTALSKISQHHLNSDKIYDVIKEVSSGRLPDEAAEHWLKEVCQTSNSPALKSNAAIALNGVIGKRDMFRQIFADADEETRSELAPELIAYLEKTPEPGESEMIEATLTEYVSDTESLLKKVKSNLFAIKNLSVGRAAPDIIGNDVDGVSFKLSDYRGKVVFLDFWGDW